MDDCVPRDGTPCIRFAGEDVLVMVDLRMGVKRGGFVVDSRGRFEIWNLVHAVPRKNGRQFKLRREKH